MFSKFRGHLSKVKPSTALVGALIGIVVTADAMDNSHYAQRPGFRTNGNCSQGRGFELTRGQKIEHFPAIDFRIMTAPRNH